MAAPTAYRPDSDDLFADADFDEDEPSTGRTALEWIIVVTIAVLAAFGIKAFVLQPFYIPSESMEPTLVGGPGKQSDRLLVEKLSYHVRDVGRGDVVVFHAPANFPGEKVDDLVKRVIGVAGDEIVFDNGRVRVNGEIIDEPYLAPSTVTRPAETGKGGIYDHHCVADDPCQVPPGHLWVMGDNRSNSEDSRYIGPISEDLVVGRAFVRMWPLNRLSGL